MYKGYFIFSSFSNDIPGWTRGDSCVLIENDSYL
jgi:hypothetical protein